MEILKKLKNNITFSDDLVTYIESIKPYTGDSWIINTNKMKEYKTILRTEMDKEQNGRCAYCGGKYGVTSENNIEHIAPKATKLYPQFEFATYNLVLSCTLCNNRSHKGEIDTISKYDNNYNKCKFIIVHPYFDDPKDHFDNKITKDNGIIFIGKSKKGLKSIEIFGLNDEPKCTERAKDVVGDYQRATMPNNQMKNLIEQALVYKV